jgi:hypothetical protein
MVSTFGYISSCSRQKWRLGYILIHSPEPLYSTSEGGCRHHHTTASGMVHHMAKLELGGPDSGVVVGKVVVCS